jgi:hypothetical protein
MRVASTISELPNVPAVYAFHGGRGASRHVAYVGVADKLKQRIKQHLVTRDSSVATGPAVASLNPELVREVTWWEHPAFADRIRLEAAELVAFDTLQPALRSRSASQAEARTLHADAAFRAEMGALFAREPTGRHAIPILDDALERIAVLERRLDALETRLSRDDD